jgi:hypothetical protein
VGVIVKRIGYWKSDDRPDLPDPADFVDTQWDDHERDMVAWYFESAPRLRTYGGPSTCRICGVENGSGMHSDGTYLWPEGFAHYIGEHNVRPPVELLQPVWQRIRELRDMEVDANWWNSITRR